MNTIVQGVIFSWQHFYLSLELYLTNFLSEVNMAMQIFQYLGYIEPISEIVKKKIIAKDNCSRVFVTLNILLFRAKSVCKRGPLPQVGCHSSFKSKCSFFLFTLVNVTLQGLNHALILIQLIPTGQPTASAELHFLYRGATAVLLLAKANYWSNGSKPIQIIVSNRLTPHSIDLISFS